MIDRLTYTQYRESFGETFSARLWANRPGDTVNTLMRQALSQNGPPLTDEIIADELGRRLGKRDET
jgi:hypothetical protein